MYSLVGVDGNAFSVLVYVQGCMRKENCTEEQIEAYIQKATSGDYRNLLCESMDMIYELNKSKEEQ